MTDPIERVASWVIKAREEAPPTLIDLVLAETFRVPVVEVMRLFSLRLAPLPQSVKASQHPQSDAISG